MNPKNLGNKFERECSRILSLWITNNERDDVIYRNINSGAQATFRKRYQGKETIQDGDFITTVLEYEWLLNCFFIDSKNYKEFNPFIINEKNIKSNLIFQQYIKVVNDCPVHKVPIVICNIRDRKTPQFVLVPSYFKFGFHEHSFITYSFGENSLGKNYDCVCVLLDSFVKNENAKELVEFNKKEKKV